MSYLGRILALATIGVMLLPQPSIGLVEFRGTVASINNPLNEVTSNFLDEGQVMAVSSTQVTGTVRYLPTFTDVTLTVTGIYSWGASGYLADAECSTSPVEAGVWTPLRLSSLNNSARDHLDLKFKAPTNVETELSWQPLYPDASGLCASDAQHTYTTVINKEFVYGWFFIDERVGTDTSEYADNSGPVHLSYQGTRLRKNGNQGYRCDKPINADPNISNPPQVGAVVTATLTIDSRGDGLEHDVPPTSTLYYEGSGHWGTYTCNWLDPARRYRVWAKGTYKYDMTAPSGYAEADAECATGWPHHVGIDAPDNTDTATSTAADTDEKGEWLDKYIPPYYWKTYGELPPFPSSEDPYGGEWEPDRYKRPNGVMYDRLDVAINHNHDIKWTPLNEVSGSIVTGTAGTCSNIHEYYYDFKRPLENGLQSLATETVRWFDQPVLFRINDVRDYVEWDNCGRIRVEIQSLDDAPTTSPGSDDDSDRPRPATVDLDSCPWTPIEQHARPQLTVQVKDEVESTTTITASGPTTTVTPLAAWYAPTATVIRAVTGEPVYFHGDADAKLKHSVSAYMVRKSEFSVTGSLKAGFPKKLKWRDWDPDTKDWTAGGNAGAAEDAEALPFMFDLHPLCDGTGPYCMKAHDSVSWQPPPVPTNTVYTVYYVCKTAPENMRGILVIVS